MPRLTPLIPALIFLVTGCVQSRPDFEQLYRDPGFESRHAPAEAAPPPVVVIPGLLGSRLVDAETGREVWPNSMLRLAFGRYKDLELPIDDPTSTTLEPRGITETAVGRDFYGRLLHTLEEHGGYLRSDPGTPITDPRSRRLYVFDYDWRQDNVITARRLKRFLDDIRTDYEQPGLRVDVIAHSMGGLMARYFLRYGAEDVLNDNRLQVTWAGAGYLNKLILLGSPNLGSVSSIDGFVRGQPVGLRRIPPEVVATMPSTYQLFPHRIVDWLYAADGAPLDTDPFDVATWQRFGWNVFDPTVSARVVRERGDEHDAALRAHFERAAERARRFSWSLTVCPNYDDAIAGCPDEIPEPPVRLVVFGGNCTLTPSRYVLEDAQHIRFRPNQIADPDPRVDYDRLMLAPGDGTVTKPSLLARDALSPNTPRHEYSYFPLAYAFLLCESHATLTGNVHFQDNLLDVLLTRALPWQLHLDHGFSRAPTATPRGAAER